VDSLAASVEARLNATDAALSPHAGGTIIRWSDPHDHEVRDDQGISVKNPDTGQFMRYRLAGAYDSNIALLVTAGGSRHEAFARLADILRVMKLRGTDLSTNLHFHYGLVNWFLANQVYGQTTTAFLKPYLSQVGLLAEAASHFDIGFALEDIARRYGARATDDAQRQAVVDVLTSKQTLLQQPILRLLQNPHVLAGWLCRYRSWVRLDAGRVSFAKNPLLLIDEAYHFLNMDYRPELPASHCIWVHDHELLERGKGFYGRVMDLLEISDWPQLDARLRAAEVPAGLAPEKWSAVRAAHVGWQMGPEVIGALFAMADRVGFFDLAVTDDLQVPLPDRLTEADLFDRMRRVLSPPPATKADEIVAVSGGMFYSREAPDRPPLINVGDHFEKGQPLYLIEVMKMFNKVAAPFSGTIDELLVDNADGAVVHKGQPLFKVTPDEKVIEIDPAELERRKREDTTRLLDAVF